MSLSVTDKSISQQELQGVDVPASSAVESQSSAEPLFEAPANANTDVLTLSETASTTSSNGVDGVTASSSVDSSKSTNSASNSAQIEALKQELSTKEAEIKEIDSDINTNSRELSTATAALGTATATVKTTKAAYEKAGLDYSAAESELEKLESANIISRLFNTSKINSLKSQVADLKSKAEAAQRAYEKAVEDQKAKLDKVKELVEERKVLTQAKTQATSESNEIQQQIEQLQSEAQEEAEQTDETTPAADEPVEETGLDVVVPDAETDEVLPENVLPDEETTDEEITDEEVPADDETADDADAIRQAQQAFDNAVQEALNEAEQSQAEFQQGFVDFTRDRSEISFDRVFDIFADGVSADEISFLGLSLLDMVSEASKVYEANMASTVYSKSSSMASADAATTKEHSKAESTFTDAILEVSNIVGGTDIEFFDFQDKSNYELGMNILDRITDGEYIKTDVLEKQTSIAQNIQVKKAVPTDETQNDEKFEQYSDAILDELKNISENPFGAEISDDDYNAIEAKFNFLAAKDIEDAFDFLKDEAREYGITEAVAA